METNKTNSTNWKTQTYMMGIIFGIIFGLLAAYMFTRAAEEDVELNGKPQQLQAGQMIAIALASLTLIRQIAELGKAPKKK